MFRSSIRVFALPIALAVFWVACGSGTEATTTTSHAGTATTSATPEPSTPASSTTTSPRSTTTTTGATTKVTIYFATGVGSDCSEVTGFERQVPGSIDPMVSAFNELVAGPNAEEEASGAGSFFSDVTAGGVRSIGLADGLLSVDFKDFASDLNNASTSCGSASLLASLNATAFEFDGVERVRYSFFGSCNAFYGLLQSECQDQTRTGTVAVDLSTSDEASGSGCTPGEGALPDGDWFGYVDAASGGTIEFDLACWFTGLAAANAATEDGAESPPPNDYYVRNQSTDLRTVPVAAGSDVSELSSTGGPDATDVSFEEWAAAWAAREFQPGVWTTIENGDVVDITEQYVP